MGQNLVQQVQVKPAILSNLGEVTDEAASNVMETEAVVPGLSALANPGANARQQTAPIREWRALTRRENEIAGRGEPTGDKDCKGGLSKRQLMQLARFHSRRRDANATLVKVNFRPRQAGRLTAP